MPVAAKVYPLSPDTTAASYIPSLINKQHSGTYTSASGICIRGNSAFICEPAQNLVQRQVLTPAGATFTAAHPTPGRDFLATPDQWFRPVHTTVGPDLRGTVVFRALGYPSREGLPEYLAYRAEVESLAEVVNRRWATPDWQPIELDLDDDFPRSVAHLRRYDVLLVNPIRDGLNLVAEEGALVNERDGTVVLSREAGVHDVLAGAVRSVNPFDVEDQAAALAEALDMAPATRKGFADELRRRAEARGPADWLADQLAAVAGNGELGFS